jgi:uncharacterized glyoxalase superfamily protein PhnB
MITGINHFGIVVKNLDDVIAFLKEAFGAQQISRVEFLDLKQIIRHDEDWRGMLGASREKVGQC